MECFVFFEPRLFQEMRFFPLRQLSAEKSSGPIKTFKQGPEGAFSGRKRKIIAGGAKCP